MDQQKKVLPKHERYLLLQKYQAMTVDQLKNEKSQIVTQLQQINQLVAQLVQNANESVMRKQDIDSQISIQKKLQNSLIKSLSNFQFMMSSDYSIKLEEQMQKTKRKIKKIKNEVSRLTRQLSAPLQKNQNQCDELESALLKMQMQIEEGKVRIYEKQNNLRKVIKQNNFKAAEIHRMSKNIKRLSQIDQKEMQNGNEGEKNVKSTEEYEKLLVKRDKLKKFIESSHKKWSVEYKARNKKYQQLNNNNFSLSKSLKQIQKAIEFHETQVHHLGMKKRVSQSRKKRMNSEGAVKYGKLRKKKLSANTDFNTTFLIQRQKKASRARDVQRKRNKSHKKIDSDDEKQQFERNSQNLLPQIYKILGKDRALIEEEEDLRDLIYH